MKKLSYLFLMVLTALSFTACDDDQAMPNGYVSQTQEASQTIVLKGATGPQQGYNTLIPDPFRHPIYISVQEDGMPQLAGAYFDFYMTACSHLDQMTEVPDYTADGWTDNADIVPGKCYWAKYYDNNVFRFMKLRVDYLEGNNVGIEYYVTDNTQERPNGNVNANDGSDNPGADGLAIPHLNAANFFAAHYVDYDGKHIMNLAVEWNAAMRHSSWVAFSFDATTSQDNVKRSDAWAWDALIPAENGSVAEADHKSDGYDKGHLCASEDRVYCTEANKQTFFYSNISPQIGSFNQKFWAKLEALVQKWGRSTQTGTYDNLYVAKGGTLNKLLTNFTGAVKANDGQYPTADAEGKTKHGLAVPAYYYMALLAEKDGKYHAIAFLVPHSEELPSSPSSAELQSYTCSIDYLEEQTGIDFFCNLTDNEENAVEATFSFDDWQW